MKDTLTSMSDTVIEVIQELIQLNIDSAEGFTAAAEMIDDSSLASAFREYASERADNAAELKSNVAYNGEEPSQSGSTLGTLHRWWLELRGRITSDKEYSVLTEAERGEDAIKKRYEEALRQTSGTPIHDTLSNQYSGVKTIHDRVRHLRDARKNIK